MVWGNCGVLIESSFYIQNPEAIGDLTSCAPLESHQQRTITVGGPSVTFHSTPEWTLDQGNKGIFFLNSRI